MILKFVKKNKNIYPDNVRVTSSISYLRQLEKLNHKIDQIHNLKILQIIYRYKFNVK